MNLLKTLDINEGREHIIDSYGDIFDNMKLPIGFTFNLRQSKRIRDDDGDRKTIALEDTHLDNIWNVLTTNILHATYPRYLRKSFNRPPLAIGGFETGITYNNPHIHCVVDNVNDIPCYSFKWIIQQCLQNTKEQTRWLGKNIHFNNHTDRNYVSYFLKSSKFVSLYC
jgi:hypothetical protein